VPPVKVAFSLSFYHIPEFLKNDSDKDQKSTFSTVSVECSFLSFNNSSSKTSKWWSQAGSNR
ncbi:hypothetical protein NPS29_28730, partial [Pseudomonas putida]|uniref:hypothetical protein n=1 Tax=Pseudomonas putida TaxID=303 RepID=UPI0023638E7D